jgi:hypothetical protein
MVTALYEVPLSFWTMTMALFVGLKRDAGLKVDTSLSSSSEIATLSFLSRALIS